MSRREIWLRTNRRATYAGAAAVAVAGGALAAAGAWFDAGLLRGLCWASAAPLVLLAAVLLWWARVPRLAYRTDALEVYLRGGEPIRVPIEHVECFFRGQGESLVGRARPDAVLPPQASTVIVRLAESAREFHHRDVFRTLGHWCDGYITVRGSWCEPIDAELLTRLNRRLVEVKRERAA